MTVSTLPPVFPLVAIQGQPQLVQALLLAAIEPALGGVLIQGPRGTAKSTAARALAELLAPAPFATLPLGASVEHVLGSLDLGKALAGNELVFAPGMVAKAHGGVLYVDEINLLPDAIVDVLLDVAASGVNRVERDGISHSHAARFVLIGTMNPEEGMLRPQLLDRLGLCVQLANAQDVQLRSAIVKSRLRFELDPAGFAREHAPQQAALAERLRVARARCANPDELPWSDAIHEAVAQQCIAAQVDGLRADLVMLRAARALAAWEQSPAIEAEHVARVAPLVLAHRGAEPQQPTLTQPPQPQSAPASDAQPQQVLASQSAASKPAAAPAPSPAQSMHSPAPAPGADQKGQAGSAPQALEQPPQGWGQPLPQASTLCAPPLGDALAQAAMEALAAKKARAPGLPR
ncbi:ATP-binding protein [Comamonas sp. GB3 AK4-5]|uniref:ATP-binding protein n=1 Tax=Comamonas sp. GB3 AK4-5 TaxID=3231487 RepID=UPI00351E4AB3